MKIAVATDNLLVKHRQIIDLLTNLGCEVTDINKGAKLSIWDAVYQISKMVNDGEVSRAIILDNYAQASFMIANKFPNNIVASLYDEYSAAFTMKHNNSNIVCFAGKITDIGLIKELIKIYINTDFDAGRHMVRIDMLSELLKGEK